MAVRSCQYSPGTVILMKGFSLFHMKFTAVLQKNCIKIVARAIYTYVFFLTYAQSSSAGKQRIVVIAVFLGELDRRPLLNNTYYKTILM